MENCDICNKKVYERNLIYNENDKLFTCINCDDYENENEEN